MDYRVELEGNEEADVPALALDRALAVGLALADAMAGHDAVVNLATKIPGPADARKPAAWAENSRIRTEGSAALVDAALDAGVGRFVQESITFAYPSSGDAFVDEDTPLDEVIRTIYAQAAHEATP